MLYPVSYNSDPRGSLLVGIEPTPLVPEVTQAFTTPQTLFCKISFLASLPAIPVASPHTPQAYAREPAPVHHLTNKKSDSREEPASTDWGFEPPAFRLYHEVTVDFTIPGKLARDLTYSNEMT
jgi:hypothetical protein